MAIKRVITLLANPIRSAKIRPRGRIILLILLRPCLPCFDDERILTKDLIAKSKLLARGPKNDSV